MSTENENKSHRGIVMVIAVAILLPVLYVLSIGPAFFIAQKYPKCGPVLEEFYRPVEWLADHTPLGKPLNWYVGLWGQPEYID